MRIRIAAAALLALAACGEDKPADGSTTTTTAAAPQGSELTQADVEAFVRKSQSRAATGVGGQPNDITLSFQSVEIAPARTPTATETQVDGLTGNVAHDVRVRYAKTETWGNGQTATSDVGYRYTFYRNSFGEWDALSNGPL